MSSELDLVITGAEVLVPDPKSKEPLTASLQKVSVEIGIRDGRIVEVATKISTAAKKTMKAKGLTALPGVIDSQVHFRDPGFPDKEDLQSGSRAALMGGVTSFFDMPNTSPPTLSALDLADKISRAKDQSWSNFAFYMGGAPTNVERLAELEKLPGVCGVKIFMGSSTGKMIIGSDENLEKAVATIQRRFSVHAEDEARLQERKSIVDKNPGHVELHPTWRDEETALIATKKLVGLAKKYNKKAHVLHVTTAEEVEFLGANKDHISFEITPQHLTLVAPDCYEKLGTLAQMNPPIRDRRHQTALWSAIKNNLADVLGSDHAPHTLKEKAQIYPNTPSGMTGVQTLVPIMLNHVHEGRLSLERFVELSSRNPARLFQVARKGAIAAGFDADITLVDLNAQHEIKNSWIQSHCGWTPFDGMKVQGWVKATIISGAISMRDEEIIGLPQGQMLQFNL
jgi:dihydroorotase